MKDTCKNTNQNLCSVRAVCSGVSSSGGRRTDVAVFIFLTSWTRGHEWHWGVCFSSHCRGLMFPPLPATHKSSRARTHTQNSVIISSPVAKLSLDGVGPCKARDPKRLHCLHCSKASAGCPWTYVAHPKCQGMLNNYTQDHMLQLYLFHMDSLFLSPGLSWFLSMSCLSLCLVEMPG